jgi:hypothetical protein
MSYSDIKPRPRPKTEAEWREVRKQRYSNAGNYGGFRVLPSKVLDSDAFNELSKSSKLVLIISLSQVDYWSKKHKHIPKRESSIGLLRNDGRFSLPSNLLKERQIRGTDTIAAARKELVAAGFWETVETGSLYNTILVSSDGRTIGSLITKNPWLNANHLILKLKLQGFAIIPTLTSIMSTSELRKLQSWIFLHIRIRCTIFLGAIIMFSWNSSESKQLERYQRCYHHTYVLVY